MRRRRLSIVGLICLALAPTAAASESARLSASLTPERLGHGTTIGFGFQISAPAGETPSPLTELELRYPRALGIGVSGLGMETCLPATLEASGPDACPVDSMMGSGNALAELPFGTAVVTEKTTLKLIRAPTENGHLSVLIHASGTSPVIAQIILPTSLLPSTAPFGEQLHASVPLIPSLPGAGDISLVRLQAHIGPQGLIYDEHVGGSLVHYRPDGVLLPDSCPRGGFQFAAFFAFLDGTHAKARATVACPRRSG